MTRTTLGMAVFAILVTCAAQAGTFQFHPTPADLGDLEHQYYSTWGIQWSLPADEVVTGASLFIDNLNDWQVESNDILYVHLLDEPQLGVHRWYDNEGGGDAFAGQGVLLTTYTDDDPAPNPAEDWTYNFTPAQVASLNSYDANGRFGLGFDADCHYYNCGVTLALTTACVPEPTSSALALLAIGLVLRVTRRRPVWAPVVAR